MGKRISAGNQNNSFAISAGNKNHSLVIKTFCFHFFFLEFIEFSFNMSLKDLWIFPFFFCSFNEEHFRLFMQCFVILNMALNVLFTFKELLRFFRH